MPDFIEASDRTKEASSSQTETPLDKKQLLAIFFAQLHEGTQVGLPYLIAVYMVRDWLGPDSSEEKVGRMTGLLAASFCGAQFFSSIFWGYVSDRYGRKRLVTLSNVSSLISVLVFGLAPSYWVAFAARSLGGFLNSTFLNVKAMIGEFTDDSNQGTAMSYLGVSVGLGCVVAPVLGGSFARPCQNFGVSFPFCGPDQLFQRRPFFLPCLAVASLSVMATLSSIFLLQETLPRIVAEKQLQGDKGARYHKLKDGLQLAARPRIADPELPSDAESLPLISSSPPSNKGRASNGSEPASNNLLEENSLVDAPNSITGVAKQAVQSTASNSDLSEETEPPGRHPAGKQDQMEERPAGKVGHGHAEIHPWYTSRQVMLTLAGYGMVAFSYNLLDELLPLYASAPIELGGLLLPANQLAVPLMASGPVMIIFSIWILPPLQRSFSVLTTMRTSLLIAAPLVLMVPFASLVAGHASSTLAILTAAYCCIRPVSTAVFTCSMVLVNTAGPKSQLGAVNALGQMIAAFVRALGPFLGGLLWGGSLELPFPGHEYVCFSLVACLFISMQLVYAHVRS